MITTYAFFQRILRRKLHVCLARAEFVTSQTELS
jgi:hypothetical protein